MHLANAVIHHGNLRIRWPKADDLLHSRITSSMDTVISPDAKSKVALRGEIQIAVGHRRPGFHLHSARVYDAGKFRQHAVAGGLLADLRIDEFDEMRFDAFVRAFVARPQSSANSPAHWRRGSRRDGGCRSRWSSLGNAPVFMRASLQVG